MIPKKVDIGGQIYKIIPSKSKCLEDGVDTWARFMASQNVVYYVDELLSERIEQNISHEILHLFFMETGLSNYLETNNIPFEAPAIFLENIFWQFLKNNTNFFDEAKEVKVNFEDGVKTLKEKLKE
jgi:hypothetical protein